MRLPNGFGNVSKLPGNRRKPYRVRVTVGWETDETAGTIKQKFKTIGYYETKEEGLIALSNYHQNPYDMDSSKIILLRKSIKNGLLNIFPKYRNLT